MTDIQSLLQRDFTRLQSGQLEILRKEWAKDLGFQPKNSKILETYRSLVNQKKLVQDQATLLQLKTRTVRTMSGVTPFAVMTKPFHCPGECVYCPLESGMPKSYLSDEPAAQRAKNLNFDPFLQIKTRLDQLTATGHQTDKIELIVIGGTFSAYPQDYREEFFKRMFDACNDSDSSNLTQAQEKNEQADRRIVGISIETRPDWISEDEVKFLRYLGVTKLQVGVQAFDESILRRINRGHSLEPVAEATRMLRDAGFKICYHFMPNLPGSNPKLDVDMAKIMYTDPRFKPDFVKIYPCMVIPGTQLEKMWQNGEVETYSDKTLKQVLKEIKKMTPPWTRIDRLVRDISKKWIASGTNKTNMRQEIQDELCAEGQACQCIRCREVKNRDYARGPELIERTIPTLGGLEIFLSFEKDNRLYSLLRLRLPDPDHQTLFPELRGAAIIREVHTFGQALPLNNHESDKTQHQGLGQRLLAQAEAKAKAAGFQKLAVISAIGTRGYYHRFGYEREGLYMTKMLC